MSAAPTAPAVPPADAGLPGGRAGGAPSITDAGDDLISKAASGVDLEPKDQEDLLGYFLANGELPGDSKPRKLEFTIGNGPDKVRNVWQVRRIGWEEWFDAQTRATDETTGQMDGYVAASYVLARALLKPALGSALKRLQDEARNAPDDKIAGPGGERLDPPKDAAEILRRMFRKQAGTLLDMSGEVRRVSRLAVAMGDESSARTIDEEVEAAKG